MPGTGGFDAVEGTMLVAGALCKLCSPFMKKNNLFLTRVKMYEASDTSFLSLLIFFLLLGSLSAKEENFYTADYYGD